MRNRERIATLLFPTGYLSEIGPYPAFDPRLPKNSWASSVPGPNPSSTFFASPRFHRGFARPASDNLGADDLNPFPGGVFPGGVPGL